MKNISTVFITFFSVFPNTNGSAAMINNRFNNWPYRKKLFFLSEKKPKKTNKYYSIKLKKEKPIYKLINIPLLIFKVYNYLKKFKKKIIVIEGSSWILYSFISYLLLKFLLPESKIIYISHNVEAEIRKKKSKIIYIITKILEKFIFKNISISTVVSDADRLKIKKLYNVNAKVFPNATSIKFKKTKINIKEDYMIYSGSYLYGPNKDAIDYLNQKIMPNLIKKKPKLKLVLTGGGYNKKFPWLINKKIVSKNQLYNLVYKSKIMCVPLRFGSGTRIKILEALSIGTIVISTTKGIEGIKLNASNPPYVISTREEFLKKISNVLKNYKKNRMRSESDKYYYLSQYSMNNVTKNFIKKYLLKIIC
jgi:hypothetical protein